MAAPLEVHARQLRALLERLDVACGVAVASTNGERGMRPRGREVEKRVGSALSVTPKNGKFHRKSGLVRNSERRKFLRTLTRDLHGHVPCARHVHARQLREMLEHLDVACGVAVASTNGERGMRPRGREVE